MQRFLGDPLECRGSMYDSILLLYCDEREDVASILLIYCDERKYVKCILLLYIVMRDIMFTVYCDESKGC